MAASGVTRANANRKIRQEALREQLAAGGHVEHVIDISNKLADLSEEMDSLTIQRLKAAADIKKSLISKYLPDTKAMEITGEAGEAIDLKYSVEVVDAKDTGS